MIGKKLSAILFTIAMISGVTFAQIGHGTHVAGTIGTVGNNGTAIGGSGRDVLIGGVGSDRLAGTVSIGSFAGQTIRLRIATANNFGGTVLLPPFSIEIG